MTTRENAYPTACVIKTSKNVTAQMKLPMWNRERNRYHLGSRISRGC